MPSGNGLGPKVRDNADGTICVEYEPKKEGRHEVLMSYDGSGVDGSPFACVVDKIENSFITAFGAGLVGGLSGDSVGFTVVAKRGTAKDIEVKIDGPAKVDLQRKDNDDGSANFNYMPMTPGAYNINIKYHGKPIKGSPFVAKVSGEGRKRSTLSLANSAEYSLKIIEPDIVDLVGTVQTPGGQIEPIILKKMDNGELGIAYFTPRQKGEYVVCVLRSEKNINNSPFRIKVGDKEIGHAAGCTVKGDISEALANKSNEVIIDTTNGGYGGLTVSIEGPHRSEVEVYKVEDRVYTVHYSPHEPGIYILNIRFADEDVPGSPFLVNVGGNPSGRVRETITKDVEPAAAISAGSPSEFVLQIPGTNPFDMEASMTDPEGISELCEVMDQEDFHYLIKMTPKTNGLHTVSIKHKGMHVSGSPFQFSVGQLSHGGPHKVQVGGPGLEKGEVGLQNVFNIYTREAGPGTLSVAVEGTAKATIQLEQRPNGFLGAQYKTSKPGMYGVHVKYNDVHIPGSPFMVNVAPDSGVARQISIHALKDKGLLIDKPVTFSVAFNGAQGHLHATVRTPSGGHMDCLCQEMDTGVYAVRFIPKENGVHYVDVKLNDAHIPDSPIPIMVGSTASDPAMVTASGDGLEHGKCGAKNKFIVRTAGAGSGLLAVFIDGPSKSALSCKELDEGYEFSYTPFCPGNYLITVKYGNIPIAGSPYQAVVTGAAQPQDGRKGVGRKPSPVVEQSSMAVETVEKKAGAGGVRRKLTGDASKVIAKGPGLKKAFTNRVQTFNVEIKDAGNAVLSIGMISPSGFPEAELSLKKVSQTTYTVNYKVQEIGEHILHIKWGDDEIPGSPFVLTT
ncbi:filamin-A-like isoform X2 [Biomphalaria glabrata]|uniref:Filamin-A-like isoform X2 n=1 Tax=Biomphalaria glabrata TaxID=6526 RepID=A0A9W2ZP97_BIOGL|nr:filamin-A-like isoform X2 [Biomphalaria glabrata]